MEMEIKKVVSWRELSLISERRRADIGSADHVHTLYVITNNNRNII